MAASTDSEHWCVGLQAKKRLIFTFTTSLVVLLSSVTIPVNNALENQTFENTAVVETASNLVLTPDAESVAVAETNAKRTKSSVEQYVRHYFKNDPILAEVAKCESWFRQFDKDGKVIRGIQVREDVGVMQINETYHKVTAEKLGFDIYSLDGNLSYAKYLYERQGTQPWSASERCWSKSV